MSLRTFQSCGMAQRKKRFKRDTAFVENGRRQPQLAMQSTEGGRRWEVAQDLSCLYRELCGGDHENEGVTEVPAAAGYDEEVAVEDLRSKDHQEVGQCLRRLVEESIEGLDEFHPVHVKETPLRQGSDSSAQALSIFDAAPTVLARCAALGDSDHCESDQDARWCRRMRREVDEIVRDVCEEAIKMHRVRAAMMGSSRAVTLELQDALRDLQGLAKDVGVGDDQQGIQGAGDALVSTPVFKDVPQSRIEEAYLRAAFRLDQSQLD